MDLVIFQVENFRRFKARSSIKTPGRMVGLVGPNEAGKSSILKALSLAGSDEPYDYGDFPRRSSLRPALQWTFELDTNDLGALRAAGLSVGSSVLRFIVSKDINGRTFTIQGSDLAFNNFPRDRFVEAISRISDVEEIRDSFDFELLTSLLASSSPTTEIVSDSMLASLKSAVETTSEIGSDLSAELVDIIDQFVVWTQQPEVEEIAVRVLKSRIPNFILFGSDDRDLKSEYDLTQAVDDMPAALNHLEILAQIDLPALNLEISEGRHADALSRVDDANEVLSQVFNDAWQQQGVCLQLSIDGNLLRVFAAAPSGRGFTELQERSEGMRWFAMLLAFAHGWPDRPVLLADEIETHLHYDAQADIVNALASQESIAKIIYTTHSFGCLPDDLGRSINVVRMHSDHTSALETGIWRGGAGFSPLMAAIGAAAVSFTPSRRVVLGEGPSEAVLLPSLLRGVKNARLSFQVAPGLSTVANRQFKELEREAPFVAYLVDGDSGGRILAEGLVSEGVEESKIARLTDEDGSEFDLEDLVDPAIYVDAVNAVLQTWQRAVVKLSVADLSSPRSVSVRNWCKANGLDEPDKVEVAYRVLELGDDSEIVNKNVVHVLSFVLERLESALGLTRD